MIKFTRYHSNRGSYSWLIFDTYEKIIHSNEEFLSGTLYYLGSGELPYKEYFLSHADRYVAVGWAGRFHTIRADIDADLSKPLPIDSEVADSIVSLSVLENLYEPQLMIDEAFRILLGTLFALFWHLGQLISPLFDRLDRNWELEAPGYFVTVHKP